VRLAAILQHRHSVADADRDHPGLRGKIAGLERRRHGDPELLPRQADAAGFAEASVGGRQGEAQVSGGPVQSRGLRGEPRQQVREYRLPHRTFSTIHRVNPIRRSTQMRPDPFANRKVKTSLIHVPGIAMPTIGQPSPPASLRRKRTMTRKQCWMLVLAFEVLVFGVSQSIFRPARQAGITIEMSVTPNHVVT
jgi:hypothetical protein